MYWSGDVNWLMVAFVVAIAGVLGYVITLKFEPFVADLILVALYGVNGLLSEIVYGIYLGSEGCVDAALAVFVMTVVPLLITNLNSSRIWYKEFNK